MALGVGTAWEINVSDRDNMVSQTSVRILSQHTGIRETTLNTLNGTGVLRRKTFLCASGKPSRHTVTKGIINPQPGSPPTAWLYVYGYVCGHTGEWEPTVGEVPVVMQ